MTREKKIIQTSLIGAVVNLVLVVLKASIGLLSNSIDFILDAINNLSDTLSSLITIIGTKHSLKAPDQKHPLGYGRIEYLTSLIVAAFVFCMRTENL
ncbi:cation transporter [Dubosiella newyorkensis]|jgi:divalent metal cation (Fe/Co/Zn/Cd) transporter|uniref:cation transporter n=1 Tax=Dubosiella newyorkensis TaxID=1862672 RepID=UPI0023548ECE|nr:cation transporter [Dubosiella newyorkensis]MCI9042067.1 cation transporter [Dubosiella newyorkensis]